MSYNNTEGEEEYDPLLIEQESDAVPSQPQLTPQPKSQFFDVEQYKIPPVPSHLIRPPPVNHAVTVRQPMSSYLAQTGQANQSSSSDHYLNLAVFLTILCFFCGSFLVLFCTIPAIIYASQAKDEELRGDMEAAQRSRSMCILFSIGAILFGCAMVTVAILFTADEEDLEEFLTEQKSQPPKHQLTLQPMNQFVVTEQYQVPPNVIPPPAANHAVTLRQPMSIYQPPQSSQTNLSHYYLGFSIFLTVLCFSCGSFLVILCTIPAMLYAIKSKDEELRGDMVAAENSRCISMTFNVAAMIAGGIMITVISYVALSMTS